MKLITLPQLRMAQLQTLAESTIQLVTPISEVSSETTALMEAFSIFQQGMIKKYASSDKRTLDRSRDLIASGFFKSIEAEQLFPAEETTKTLLDEVLTVVDKYGFELSRLPYNEQTSKTDNMLNELSELDLSAFPSLQRWIAPIQEANTAFKAASQNYLEEVVESEDTLGAYESAITLQESLNKLFTMLFAHAQVTGNEDLVSTYKELDALVESYK